MSDHEPRKIILMCPITVWGHPMTDGRTYLSREGSWGSYKCISEGDHDLEDIGRTTGKFFDFVLGPDGEIARLASADTHPKDGDVKQAPLVSGAVGNAETPQSTPPSSGSST